VLIIDEAYDLNDDQYGKQALNTIVSKVGEKNVDYLLAEAQSLSS